MASDLGDIAAWRKARRAELIARREALTPEQRRDWSAALERNLRDMLAEREPSIISFYWPFRGEFGARRLIVELLDNGWRAALPVVVQKKAPLQFRLWTPDATMEKGIWDIPQPRDGAVVAPRVVLAPLVGFDDDCYRLGYGGGYYDRTLVTISPPAFAIGVGFEFQRLDTIYPQPFDRRLDAIVTEAGTRP